MTMKRRNGVLAMTGLLLSGIVLSTAGCSRITEMFQETSTVEGEYTIYYTDAEGTSLIGSGYDPEAVNFDGILMELLDHFQNADVVDMISVLPASVKLNGYTRGVDNLTIDFNAAYLGLTNVQEVLLRAGIVRTLVQLPGVRYVSVTVDGQPIKDSDGSAVGAMNEDTFIDSQGNGINSLRYLNLDLYFADSSGQNIVKEERSGTFTSNLSEERVIVEEIIKGPTASGLYAVTGSDVKINDVKITDDICVIDLDLTFNSEYNAMLTPEVVLYAFVNSICETMGVHGVQFQIEGSTDVRFLGQINLDQTFERNGDVVAERNEETAQTQASGERETDLAAAENADNTNSLGSDSEERNDTINSSDQMLIGIDSATHEEE